MSITIKMISTASKGRCGPKAITISETTNPNSALSFRKVSWTAMLKRVPELQNCFFRKHPDGNIRTRLAYKGLQKKSIGRQVYTQERRAFLVPVIPRLQTACQLMILFPYSVYIWLRLFVLLGSRSGVVFTMRWKVRGTLFSWVDCSVSVQS